MMRLLDRIICIVIGHGRRGFHADTEVSAYECNVCGKVFEVKT